MKSLFMILLILAILPVSICLMCYGYNNYEEAVTTLHHRKFCTAVYSVHDGIGVFGGGERHPSRIPNIVELKDDHDCVFQTVESNFGIPASDYWLCYCFTNLCNFPFSYSEFKARNFTLKPTYGTGN
ncbi:hypothetical protein L5515_019501 [Caenorhabditis briggsae]|uniref:Uncharacterized protein n=1 Tax=Caenorhabditis briggsae TaxID=6238 RepID=A0AAE9FEV3_CAEBR|nr:hypothetical protein L5515_019501 [Caenorhabditis briggsae]